MSAEAAGPFSGRTARAPDLLNFFLADVRDGLGPYLAGWIVVVAGYDVAFGSLGAIAGVGLLLYLAAMPETGPNAATRAKNRPAAPPPNGGGGGERSR